MVRREPGLVEIQLSEENHAHFQGDGAFLVLVAPHPHGMGTELAAVLTLIVLGLCALAAMDRPIMLRVRTLSGVSSFPREHPLASSCADSSEGQSGI